MRAIPILASLLLAAPLTTRAASESSSLEKRCAEQERQIRQLEEENSRLKSMISTGGKTAPVEAPKTEEKASKSSPDSDASKPIKVIVRSGDDWVKIARRNDTTVAALTRLNKMKESTDLRAGQEILVPASKKKEEIASSEEKESRSNSSTHTVKEGETYYSIAKRYGISPEALQDANPKIKATALREGLTLRLGAGTVVTKAGKPEAKASEKKAVASKSPSKKSSEAKDDDAPASKPKSSEGSSRSQHQQELAAKAPSSSDNVETDNSPRSSGNELVTTSKPRVHNVNIDDEISFGSFAQAHGTTPEKLNALNGLTLNPSTVLARGSELRVPAQP